MVRLNMFEEELQRKRADIAAMMNQTMTSANSARQTLAEIKVQQVQKRKTESLGVRALKKVNTKNMKTLASMWKQN